MTFHHLVLISIRSLDSHEIPNRKSDKTKRKNDNCNHRYSYCSFGFLQLPFQFFFLFIRHNSIILKSIPVITSTIAFACLQCMFQRNLNLRTPKVHLFPVPNKYFLRFFNVSYLNSCFTMRKKFSELRFVTATSPVFSLFSSHLKSISRCFERQNRHFLIKQIAQES